MFAREYDPFVHRANRDGTTDSICKECFVTVCTSVWETELARAERAHVCDPDVVAHWKEIQGRTSQKPA
jgi:hypothetical protein